MKKITAISVLAVLLLNGCATGCETVSAGNSGGYSETRLNEDTFDINFIATNWTERDTVSDYTLLRVSELTIENKYQYFIVLEAHDRYGHGLNIHKTIKCFKAKPKTEKIVYEARFVERSMKKKYKV